MLPINSYLDTKSRMVISSGGVKPVLDGGGGDHSIFARMLINKLSIKDITDLISQNSNVPKKEIYNHCLKLKNEK